MLAAWVLAVGLVAHGVGGSDLIVKSDMTAASYMPSSGDMPMSGKCNGCAGDEKGIAPAAACSAFCGAVITVPAVALVRYAVPAEALSPGVEPNAIGHADPPEPYPPRSTVLS